MLRICPDDEKCLHAGNKKCNFSAKQSELNNVSTLESVSPLKYNSKTLQLF